MKEIDWTILPGGILGGLAMAALFGAGAAKRMETNRLFILQFSSFPRFSATLKKGRRAACPFVVLSFYTRCFDRSSKVFQLGISLRRVSQAGIAVRVVARMASNASSW